MNVITLITKKSLREVLKEKIFLKFFSSKNFSIGSLIEIIEGNKKSFAVILKNENIIKYKQELRSGKLELKKIKLSKTGENAKGKIIDVFTLEEIKKKKEINKIIKNFFPKKRLSKDLGGSHQNKTISDVSDFSSLTLEKYQKKTRTYYNENQELVDTIRKYFSEKVVHGIGSFSYYLGFFKKIPTRDIKQFFAEAKQSKVPVAIQKRIF